LIVGFHSISFPVEFPAPILILKLHHVHQYSRGISVEKVGNGNSRS